MNDLVKLEGITAVEVFSKGGLDPLLKQIAAEAETVVPDLSTVKGRKAIASLANKVARSKTFLDGLGKDFVAGQKEEIKKVDSERKRCRDFLDDLKARVRKPLSDLEESERERERALNQRVADIQALLPTEAVPSAVLLERVAEAESVVVDRSFAHLQGVAEKTKEETLAALKARLVEVQAAEREKAELERLALEAADQERQVREARIAAEAGEKARLEAEAKAKWHQDAEEAARRREQAEAARRAADIEHRRRVNAGAVDALVAATGIDSRTGMAVVIAIVKGSVPGVRMEY